MALEEPFIKGDVLDADDMRIAGSMILSTSAGNGACVNNKLLVVHRRLVGIGTPAHPWYVCSSWCTALSFGKLHIGAVARAVGNDASFTG